MAIGLDLRKKMSFFGFATLEEAETSVLLPFSSATAETGTSLLRAWGGGYLPMLDIYS